MVKVLLFICWIFVAFPGNQSNGNAVNRDLFPVSIIHINDYHARFEEIDEKTSNTCKPEENQRCVGGYARIVTMVKHLLVSQKEYNPVYLNAGDNFQGSLWYNILRGEVLADFLNELPADAITIGNHEFDHKIKGLIPFLKTIKSPILVSNMDASEEPSIQGLYNNSLIIERSGRKIGIIGVILSTTNEIAQTEKLRFLNEPLTVKSEATKLKAAGCNIIIVLSHCGLNIDLVIARDGGSDIDVVIGGHTHTFMYTGENYPGPYPPTADYPEIVTQSNGHSVLVVQASSFSKYVGNLTVWFDESGELKTYSGSPIYLDENVLPDPVIIEKMKPYKEIVDNIANEVVGITEIDLNKDECSQGDCSIGNLIADSFVYYHKNYNIQTKESIIGLYNAGDIRVSLSKGDITYGDLKAIIPFDNSIDILELQGQYISETIEYGLLNSYELQVSGLRIIANITKPIGHKIISIEVLCRDCHETEYYPLEENKYYQITMVSFLANGGYGFTAINDHKRNHKTGAIDIDVLTDYVKEITPITEVSTGRFVISK